MNASIIGPATISLAILAIANSANAQHSNSLDQPIDSLTSPANSKYETMLQRIDSDYAQALAKVKEGGQPYGKGTSSPELRQPGSGKVGGKTGSLVMNPPSGPKDSDAALNAIGKGGGPNPGGIDRANLNKDLKQTKISDKLCQAKVQLTPLQGGLVMAYFPKTGEERVGRLTDGDPAEKREFTSIEYKDVSMTDLYPGEIKKLVLQQEITTRQMGATNPAVYTRRNGDPGQGLEEGNTDVWITDAGTNNGMRCAIGGMMDKGKQKKDGKKEEK